MKPDTLEKLTQFLQSTISPGSRILAAVSGGSDSTAMLVLLAEASRRFPFSLSAAVVNHGLRAGVEHEIALVQRTAEKLGVLLRILEIPSDEAALAATKGSLQAWARQRRYELLKDAARAEKAAFVATGHTLDDQAETVLLRILRGTGLDGLSGIRRVRALDDDLTVIRPVLSFGRDELRNLLNDRGVAYAEDPSNENGRFHRVRVRRELLPLMSALNAGSRDHLVSLASEAKSLVDYFESYLLPSAAVFEPLRLGSGLRVRRASFDSLPRALWGRIIRKALEMVQGNLLRLERIHIEALETFVSERRITDKVSLPEGPDVYVDRGDLLLFPGPVQKGPSGFGKPTAVGAGVWKAGFAALGASAEIWARDASLIRDLEVRTRRPGDRLFCASRKIKDVFIAGRVPRPYRDFVPLLVEGDFVVSCPGLVPSRKPGVRVNWTLDESAPFLDLDFGLGELPLKDSLDPGRAKVSPKNRMR